MDAQLQCIEVEMAIMGNERFSIEDTFERKILSKQIEHLVDGLGEDRQNRRVNGEVHEDLADDAINMAMGMLWALCSVARGRCLKPSSFCRKRHFGKIAQYGQ